MIPFYEVHALFTLTRDFEVVGYEFPKAEAFCCYSFSGCWGHGPDHRSFHVMLYIFAFFLLVRVLEFAGQLPPLAASFADDLLCLPLVLGVVLWCHRRIVKQGGQYTLPGSHGVMALVLFAVYFEGVLPVWSSSVVRDPLDVLMYLAGYLVFEIMLNRPAPVVSLDCCREPA